MKTIAFLFLTFFIYLFAAPYSYSRVDPYNTYQWSRTNPQVGDYSIEKNPWYEWWYYKIVIPETNQSFYFIYGIVNPWDTKALHSSSRSYVQMGHFEKKVQVENVFPVQDFFASDKKTFIQIRDNVATDKNIIGSLTDKAGKIYRWNITIDKKWAFNAEGWMLGKLLTDIEWYPAQADATCSGEISYDGKSYKIDHAPCYQDRNWGKQFPDWWTWIVSNHFENSPGSALAIGGGKPHLKGRRTIFASVSIGLKHNGENYTFRPIDFQYIKTNISFGKWKVVAVDRKYFLEVEANAPKEDFMDLTFITPQGVLFHDFETLRGKVRVKMYKRIAGVLVPFIDIHSNYAGIEYGSNVESN